MLFDRFHRRQPHRLRHVQADVFGFPALIVDPLLYDLLVAYNSDARFESFKGHPRKSLRVKFAQLILIIVIIGRAKDDPAQSTLRNKSVFAFGRLGGSSLRLIKRAEMLL